MKSLFLYASGDSFLHRVDPRTKFLGLIILLYFVLTTLIVPYMAAVLLMVVLLLWLAAHIAPKEYASVVMMFVPLILVVMLIQAIVRPGDVLVSLLGVQLTWQGIEVGLAIGMRLLAMALTFAAFAMTTNPNDIALALTKLRIHYRYCYLTSFALRFLPLVQEEAFTLLTAMSVRGSPDPSSPNVLKRARAVMNMLLPLIVGSLRRSIDIALAMELRGYRDDRPRTFVRRIEFKREDYLLLAGIVVFTAVSFTLKYMGVLEFRTYAGS